MDAARESGRPAGWASAALGRLAGGIAAGTLMQHLERERARWFVWLPVAFGAGIAGYFSLDREPAVWTALALLAMAVGLAAASRSAGLVHVMALSLLVASFGFVVAKARTEWTRAPVLPYEMRRADVQGIVELIEPRPGRGERLTLRVTDIKGIPAAQRPDRIRVRAMTKREGLKPGDAVRLRATLRPPSMPALPGGYDFGRTAWFQRLGATGYSIQPAEIVTHASGRDRSFAQTANERLEQLRQSIGERIRAAAPGEAGAIAVSLITGERGGIPEETTDAYRDSGIVHILSISGLHMVIMAGSVFASIRVLLALFPGIALRFATKKWAAAAALMGAAGYLLISGPSLATLRAFLMIAIMFVAVMLDRQALAMRNVAVAAIIILALMPESLLDSGFQMSFAAVVSLIAAYEAVRARTDDPERPGGSLRTVAFFLGGIVLSTVVASLAVAPLGAFHFHRSQQYALLTNLVAVPICNLIVMPAALLTLVLMPFGLEALPLAVMAKGIDLMSAMAHWVAGLPGAVIHIPEISMTSFALMIAGGLWLTLWQTRWRMLGLIAIGGGALTASSNERPDILAGRGGELVAVRAADGQLAATGPRSGNFELTRWLEHDGDARTTRDVLRNRLYHCDGTGCTAEAKGLRIAVTRHPAAIAEDCVKSEIVITEPRPPAGCTAPLSLIDRTSLLRDGTHAIYLAKGEGDAKASIARIETVASRRGERPWTAKPEPNRYPSGSAAGRSTREPTRENDEND